MAGLKRLATPRNVGLTASLLASAAAGWGLARITPAKAGAVPTISNRPTLMATLAPTVAPTTIPTPTSPTLSPAPSGQPLTGDCVLTLQDIKLTHSHVYGTAQMECKGMHEDGLLLETLQQQSTNGQWIEIGNSLQEVKPVQTMMLDDTEWALNGCDGTPRRLQIEATTSDQPGRYTQITNDLKVTVGPSGDVVNAC